MFRRPGRPQPAQPRPHAAIRRAILETLEIRRLMHADHGSTLDGQAPYFSAPFAVGATPVTVEAEHFDHGGQNVAYYDNSPGNGGGTTFRAEEDVDLKSISGGGYRVLGTYVGEWVEYTIDVAQSGTYFVDSRVSSKGSGGSFHYELRDPATGALVSSLTSAITIPNTGGHEKWTTVTKEVALPAGAHVLRLAIDTNSTYGSAGNFDWIKLTQKQTQPAPTPEPGSQQPFYGVPFSVGATAVTIQAEHFDYGGQNVAYYDNSPGNGGGTSFRSGEDVDLKSISGGGYRVLGTYSGEWIEYTINVIQAGTYALTSRVSSMGSGGSFHYELRDAASGAFVSNLTSKITIPYTGGHEKWTTLSNNVTLPGGTYVLRLAIDTNSTYGSAGNFDWIKLTSSQLTTPAGIATWETVAPAPTAHVEANSAVVGGKLYLLGRMDALAKTSPRSDVYDPVTNTWTRIADLPEAVTHAGVAVVDHIIYVAGGWVGDDPGPATNKVWKYNTLNNTWSAGPALPSARGAGVLIKLGDALHFLGGMEPDRVTDSASHWRLDLNNLSAGWVSAPNMPNPRNHLGGAAVGGKLYVIGGQHALNENTANQDDVHVYDPVSKTWSQAADLPTPRGHIAASTFARNGRIVVVGGLTNGLVSLKDVIEYDPATNTWVALTPIPATRKSPIAGVIGGEVIVSGGQTTGSSPSSTTWKLAFSRKWEIGATIPVELGEVAGGVIGNKMYVLGDGSSSTYVYNLSTGAWTTVAGPTYQGDHYAAEVYNGKLYLIGGLGAASGKLQIFNPATNQWTLGANMPFSAGSSATSLIGGMIYVAGGVVGSTAGATAGTGTTNLAARYNPATNTWTMIASMPQGRNHAAAASDGSKMYVFGGRTGNNNTSNGYNTVQIYDPATNTWQSSASSGSTIAPLPIGRGGMGKAVYFNGEFYIMGGETKDGPGANQHHTYNRVDIYNPATNTWRLGTPMPTARHGIFPLLHGGRIYVAGGGPRSMQIGYNDSNVLEIYNPF